MSVGNVHKSELNLVRLPDIAQEEDRGLNRCATPNLVLADISDNSRYRNDITRISLKVDVLTVELEKEDGSIIAAPGLAVAFPYQSDAKGFMIDWRQLTKPASGGGTILDSQCYKVKISYELAGTSGEFYYGAYELKPFNEITRENTVQVFTVLNDVVRNIGINYKDSGFAGSVRFKGTFGYMQPNFETNNITYADRTRNKVRIEALRSYELRTSMIVGCMTSQIDEQHLLAANQIWITEHHPHAHIQYNQFPVILSEDASPTIEYLAGGYAKLIAQFKDKVAVHESKYDGNIEAKINASFDLPQGVQASGCADATNNIYQSDGTTLIESVTVPSGGTEDTNIADSPITVNSDAYTDLPATDSLNIPVIDSVYNLPLETTVVGSNVEVLMFWFMVLMLEYRSRVLDDGGTFEDADSFTTNIIELNETNANNALVIAMPNGYKTSTLYCFPLDGSSDFAYIQNTGNGTRFNENSVLEFLPANTPRINWIFGQPIIQRENSRTNLVTYSEPTQNSELSSNLQGVASFVSYNFDIGLTEAIYFPYSATFNSAVYVGNTVAGIEYSLFAFIEMVDNGEPFPGIAISTAFDFAMQLGGNTVGTYETYNIPNTTTWIVKFVTTANSNSIFNGVRKFTGSLTREFNTIGFMLEVGNVPITSSYIRTSGATATKNADIYSVTPPGGTNEIVEYLEDGTTNTITTIPATYEPATGDYKRIVFNP